MITCLVLYDSVYFTPSNMYRVISLTLKVCLQTVHSAMTCGTCPNPASYQDILKSGGHAIRFNKSYPKGLCTCTLTCGTSPNASSYHDIIKWGMCGGQDMTFIKPYLQGLCTCTVMTCGTFSIVPTMIS